MTSWITEQFFPNVFPHCGLAEKFQWLVSVKLFLFQTKPFVCLNAESVHHHLRFFLPSLTTSMFPSIIWSVGLMIPEGFNME